MMKKFFVMYMAPAAEFKKMMAQAEKMQETEREKGMRPWQEWMSKNKKRFLDMGGPLGKTKRVTMDEVSDASNDMGGYTIVEAESADDAAKFAQSSPHLSQMPKAWIEVMEIIPMPA